jgi:hypothetical protein
MDTRYLHQRLRQINGDQQRENNKLIGENQKKIGLVHTNTLY